MVLKANRAGGKSAAALHFSTRRMDVTTMRTGTIFVFFMTYFLTQSIYSGNTFLENILSCWNFYRKKIDNFSPPEVTRNDKERKTLEK